MNTTEEWIRALEAWRWCNAFGRDEREMEHLVLEESLQRMGRYSQETAAVSVHWDR
jgi:hypothetical protein